jgi:hypothetical protein
MTATEFIPLEKRVKVCSLSSRYCNGQIHLYRVQADNEPEPHEEIMCAWHGQCWPRADSTRPAEEARRARRRRRANQDGQGFGALNKLGSGRRVNSHET